MRLKTSRSLHGTLTRRLQAGFDGRGEVELTHPALPVSETSGYVPSKACGVAGNEQTLELMHARAIHLARHAPQVHHTRHISQHLFEINMRMRRDDHRKVHALGRLR